MDFRGGIASAVRVNLAKSVANLFKSKDDHFESGITSFRSKEMHFAFTTMRLPASRIFLYGKLASLFYWKNFIRLHRYQAKKTSSGVVTGFQRIIANITTQFDLVNNVAANSNDHSRWLGLPLLSLSHPPRWLLNSFFCFTSVFSPNSKNR